MSGVIQGVRSVAKSPLADGGETRYDLFLPQQTELHNWEGAEEEGLVVVPDLF
ncbi:hypothetical protein PABG_11091 [Paracoccidioides brasiliensis Pb03]|uniref:Uncharacterized protein n=1 Tax=Paracoccidioides brasiliensis (strain Pb18) TaxID=502780 RepID=A0A0A0HSW8_PARBD|nr:uncharacterized protein PADG_11472 [Paracoccidioides brasiliensis Pb18]KGM92284.1 hypothetical protein PADG_11472 [Paracoccidioides brasiliensis Pb18]KGY15852.1 hypothetical protein PABG_11091 [Paracoccidioides brasiliensis Pb03]ODH51088.1 hypothetical protein GX48_02700 [Paracoccidioides brasiliensis]